MVKRNDLYFSVANNYRPLPMLSYVKSHYSFCKFPSCGTTDTTDLYFWRRFLWVSKPEWAGLFCTWQRCMFYIYIFRDIHLWCISCQSLGSRHGSWTVFFYIPVPRHWWGLKLGFIVLRAVDLSWSLLPWNYLTNSTIWRILQWRKTNA